MPIDSEITAQLNNLNCGVMLRKISLATALRDCSVIARYLGISPSTLLDGGTYARIGDIRTKPLWQCRAGLINGHGDTPTEAATDMLNQMQEEAR